MGKSYHTGTVKIVSRNAIHLLCQAQVEDWDCTLLESYGDKGHGGGAGGRMGHQAGQASACQGHMRNRALSHPLQAEPVAPSLP